MIYKWKEESLSFNLIGNFHAKKAIFIHKKLNYIPEIAIFISCHMAQYWKGGNRLGLQTRYQFKVTQPYQTMTKTH